MALVARNITVERPERESHLAGCLSDVEQTRHGSGYLDVAIVAELIEPGRVPADGLRFRVAR